MVADSTLASGACLAFTTCFMMLLLCPQVPCLHTGSCCGCLAITVFVVLPCAALLAGGMTLHMVGSMYFALDCNLGVCSSLPCLGVFASMVTLIFGPVQQYMHVWLSGEVRGLHICDASQWENGFGAYFADGWLEPLGQSTNITESPADTRGSLTLDDLFQVVEHCEWREPEKLISKLQEEGHWAPCVFGFRPIFPSPCPGDTCNGQTPCAWAVRKGEPPERAPCGHFASGGLCGTVQQVAACSRRGIKEVFRRGIDAAHHPRDEDCDAHSRDLYAGLKEVAERLQVPFEAGVPILELGPPFTGGRGIASLFGAVLLGLVYVPLPVCLFWKAARKLNAASHTGRQLGTQVELSKQVAQA